MTRPRSALVSLDDTPWYHCVSRCVRRAFLCGQDAVSGQSFEHRRGWIATRLKQLSTVFAIDVAAYAVMSNHYHAVLRVDDERAANWSVDEVLERWTTLFSGPLLVARYRSEARSAMGQAEVAEVEALAEVYRGRLHDLSWFMRMLNEYIARQANAEDGVKGRFWEGRFKSQALLDEPALLAAMAYVDLNPVRAGMAETPEASDYTSVQERLGRAPEEPEEEGAGPSGRSVGRPQGATVMLGEATPQQNVFLGDALRAEQEIQPLPQAPLVPFDATGQTPWAVPFAFDDYLELVDWTGRALRPDKRGHIDARQPRILDRLGIDGVQFIGYANRLLKAFGTAVGAPESLTSLCARRQAKYLWGMRAARRLFEASAVA